MGPLHSTTGRPKLARLTALFVLLLAPPLLAAPPPSVDEGLRELRAGAPGLAASRSRLTGLVTFLTAAPGTALSPVPSSGATAEERALSFLAGRGALFGLSDPARELRLDSQRADAEGLTHVRFGQLHEGLPVTGGEMIVHLRGDQAVSVTAKTWLVEAAVATAPAVDAATAADAARAALAKQLDVDDAELGVPRLEILNEGLLDGRAHPTRLAWFIEARRIDLREFLWIDATTGQLILRFSQRPDALSRRIHDTNSTSTLPGPLVRSEGQPATGDIDADLAYNYSGDTYNYFFTQHGRDSYDGAGSLIRSTIDFCPRPADCPYPNAFWNGDQMVYGAGFSRADDVDAHELTHAVTDTSARLFYYMQSGALNESYSDIFGETVDLLNGAGNDGAAVRWAMGEDVPGFGAFRNMMTPTLFADPGKMTDPQFSCADPGEDAGGVHSNSGVPNHAYALMTDGGAYNGFSISGIGLVKAGKIQYRALTTYLLSASDFLDNYNAVKQSCADLVGTSGITGADCVEVAEALDAVQMSRPWPCLPTQPAVPLLCPAGITPQFVYNDTFEGDLGFDNWDTTTLAGENLWFSDSDYATSGTRSLLGVDDSDAIPDHSRVYMINGVTLPAGARLQFNHSWGFENSGGATYDGGRVLFSANGGAWASAGGLVSGGAGYNGTIASGFGNPLAGQAAFVRDSYGYTATQIDLSSLAGQNVRLGFDIGTDVGTGDYGWSIDDVRIYTCTGTAPSITISDAQQAEGNSGITLMGFTLTLSATTTAAVTVSYATSNGTGAAGTDYTSKSGTITFAPGETHRSIVVALIGDTVVEPDETVIVTLTSPVNATIARTSGVGIIVNDDPASAASLINMYRLYAANLTFEHLYTTDLNEYTVLGASYNPATGVGWQQEGIAYRLLGSGGTYNGGFGTALYRLYTPVLLQHHWTTDANEVSVLSAQKEWNYEGIVGYVLPNPTTATVVTPLYRLWNQGALHLWTTDENEKNVLSTPEWGWIYEGIVGSVVP